MRLLHTVASIEVEASGPAYSVARLCSSLGALGHEVELHTLGTPSATGTRGFKDFRHSFHWAYLGPLRRLGVSAGMRRAVSNSPADVFHTHGLWTMPNIYPARAAQAASRPLVVSPRGMLGAEPLQFSPIKKLLFGALAQNSALRGASCLHATAEREYQDIRAYGLRQPVAIIANGIDIPTPQSEATGAREKPFVLSLGRVHPIKGLDALIRAWAQVSPASPGWRLRIVGPDEGGHRRELERLAEELGVTGVDFSGPVYGAEKERLLAEAALFALPTLHENFGMVVAESLASGVPVIATKGAPWAGLEEQRCGWWVDQGPGALARALREAMDLPHSERRDMGARGRAWMERDYGWNGIARQMSDVYRWLVEGGDPPSCVRMD